jgi:hypothetical protein
MNCPTTDTFPRFSLAPGENPRNHGTQWRKPIPDFLLSASLSFAAPGSRKEFA